MKKALSMLLLLVLLGACARAEDRGEFYPLLAVVTACGEEAGEFRAISCRDLRGNEWTFYDDSGLWAVGDLASLLVWDPGSEVIDVIREGNLRQLLSLQY